MPEIIKDNAVVTDDWLVWRDLENLPQQGKVIVPLEMWLKNKDQLAGLDELAVVLCNESPKALKESLAELKLIAVDFPVFTDGRGFSYARELREQLGFNGEIRAIGGFIRDQLNYLYRCGFNAFALEDENLEEALASLQDFTEFYQASPNQPQPLYRREQLVDANTAPATACAS